MKPKPKSDLLRNPTANQLLARQQNWELRSLRAALVTIQNSYERDRKIPAIQAKATLSLAGTFLTSALVELKELHKQERNFLRSIEWLPQVSKSTLQLPEAEE
jgi:hypothetical protein